VKNHEIPSENRLIHYLKKNEKNNKSIIFTKPTDGSKQAILNYKIIKKLDRYMVLEVNLETGRHHQIRVQLSKIGIPIKGDLKYGAKRANENAGIHLHARKIEFVHPVSQITISIVAPTPADQLWDYFTK